MESVSLLHSKPARKRNVAVSYVEYNRDGLNDLSSKSQLLSKRAMIKISALKIIATKDTPKKQGKRSISGIFEILVLRCITELQVSLTDIVTQPARTLQTHFALTHEKP